MKKKKSMIITAIITLIMQLAVIMPPASVFAATGNDITNMFPFITGVSIKDTSGNNLGNDVSKNAEIHVNYTWSIPNTVNINSGDYYKMQLPAQINIAAPIDQPITDSDGAKVADMHIDTTGLVTLTFTDYPSTHSNVSGNFYVDSHFQASSIGTNNPVPINFTISGQAQPVTVNVNFAQPKPTITKDVVNGGYDPATDEITWQITVNKENVNVSNASVEDTVAAGQNFVPDSVEINGNPADSGNYSYDSATGKFIYNFGNITSQQVITFKTSVHDDLAAKGQGTYNYSNTASLNYDDNGTPQSIASNTKTVSVPVKLISKTGTYNSSTKQIDWTITVNQSGRTINNAAVGDVIPTGLTLDTSTVKLNGVAGTGYTITGQNFTYNLGNIAAQEIITFSTSVDQSVYNSNNSPTYNNTATLTGDGVASGTSASKGVGVPTNIIQKQGSSYDASTGKITWTITVNSNKTNVAAGAVVTDNIPVGQTYVPDSANIDDGSNGSFTTLSDGQVVYTFTNAVIKTYTITFQTQVTDVTHYRANYSGTYSNPVNLTADGINQNTTGTQSVNSNVISKTGIGYDYATREITWKIVVDNNKMPITNAVVTDAIPTGQQYIPSSASIDDSTQGSFNSDINSTGKLTYTFTGTINKTYTITFKTKLTDLSIFNTSGDKTLNNTASITGNEIPTNGDGDSQGSQIAKNSVITKTSAYTYGNSYIDWTVKTNANWSIPLSGATITDTLQDGLSLNTDTVELYNADVNSDGSLTQGTQIDLTSQNVKYNPDTREFDFTFPQDAGTGAFILKFRTDVTKTGSYTNSVEFKGSGIDQTSSTNQSGVWFSQGGGSAIGQTGGIKVVKLDGDTSQALSGAVFEILDQYGNVKATSSPTGADGSALFNNLKYDINYSIEEITPPTGYKLNNTPYTFQLKTDLNQGTSYDGPDGVFKFSSSDSSNNIVTYNYKDTAIKGTIEFTKKGENNGLLPGATFTLYKSTDTGFNNPIATATSGSSDGKVEFDNVGYGNYIIKETNAPEGYNLSPQVLTANISTDGQIVNAQPQGSDGTDPYTLSDTKIRGNIQFTKNDENSQPLAGAVFTLYKEGSVIPVKDSNGFDVIATSDHNGIVTFSSVEYGNYIIKETIAPAGYKPYDGSLSATITENGATVTATPGSINNTKVIGGISISKTDFATSAPVRGATITVYKSDGTQVAQDITGLDGKVVFNNLLYGDYYFQETNAPVGYLLNPDKHSFSIIDNGVILTDSLTDTRITGGIKISKTDFGTSAPVPGAIITVYTSGGSQLAQKITGADGTVEFDGLDYGDYYFQETNAPAGYLLNSDKHNFSIIDNGVILTDSLTDTRITGGIKISKTDFGTSAPVPGATITVYTSGGSQLAQKITGADGTVEFDGLNYGDYYFAETNAPAGYLLNPDKHSFSIRENGVILKDSMTDAFASQISMTANPSTIAGDGKSTSVLTARIVDANNKPISGVKVDFSAPQGDFPEGSSAVTNSNGEASVVFRSSKIEGTNPQTIPVTSVVHDTVHGLDAQSQISVTFEPGSIQGTVVDNETGLPIKGAKVEVKKDFDGDGIIDFDAEMTTGDDGKYKIAVPKGDVTYDVLITKSIEINGKTENKTFVQQSQPGEMPGNPEDTFDSVKTAAGVILLQNPDGTESYLNDYSKFSIDIGNGTQVPIGNDGASKGVFQVGNLEKGKQYEFNIVYHFDNGQQIVVGKVDIVLNSDGQINISTALIDPYGVITDSSNGKVIEGADVKLYYADTKRNADSGKKAGTLVELPSLGGLPPADNKNPQSSDINGKYAYMVYPNTDYYIVATKPGYKTFTSGTIEVNNDIVKLDIQMTPEGAGSSSTNDNTNKGGSAGRNIDTNANTINQESVQQKFTETANSILPKTGSVIDTTVLMLIGIIAIAAGSVLMFVRRKDTMLPK